MNQINSVIANSIQATWSIIYMYIYIYMYMCVTGCNRNVLCVCESVCVHVLFPKPLHDIIFSNTVQFRSHYYIVSSGIITLSLHTTKHKKN